MVTSSGQSHIGRENGAPPKPDDRKRDTNEFAPGLPCVGRKRERFELARVMERVSAGVSAALVVSGDAGLGKTHLLEGLVADTSAITTRMVAGYESEARLGFASLHRLLAPFLDQLDALPAPQSAALRTAFGLRDGPPPNRFLIGLATLTLLTQVASSQALLVVVDDIQWVDDETLDVLAFVARRIDAEGIALILGVRAATDQVPSSNLVGLPRLVLEPLTDNESRRLLHAAATTTPAPHVSARIVAASHGNPLAILVYAHSLTEAELAGSSTLPTSLPAHPSLAETLADQVRRLPDDTRMLLLILSLAGAGDETITREVCRLLQLDPQAAVAAERGRLLMGYGPRARLHPLIGSIVQQMATTESRSRVHAALAEVAAARGVPDVAAWHQAMATSGYDEAVAHNLESTADRARARGGYAATARFLTMAADRTPRGTSDHDRRQVEAAQAHVIAGNSAEAERLLAECDLGEGTNTLADVARARAVMLSYDQRTAGEPVLLVRAAAELPPSDDAAAVQLLFQALRAALGSRQHTREIRLRDVAQAVLDRLSGFRGALTGEDQVHEGLALRCVAPYDVAVPVLQDALAQVTEDWVDATGEAAVLLTWLAALDVWDEAFESSTLQLIVAANRKHGALPSAWLGLSAWATHQMTLGDFTGAEASFDEATSIALSIGGDAQQVWPALISLRAWQGRDDEVISMARVLIDDWGGRRRYGSTVNFALSALVTLDLARGNYGDALTGARTVAEDDPPGHGTRVLVDFVEAAVRAGDTRAASTSLATLRSRASSTGSPLAHGLLARADALALGTSPDAQKHYEGSLERLAACGVVTETARTHLVYGEWLRRRRRRAEAGAHLRIAAERFTAMGAMAFATRTAAELAAIGEQPHPENPAGQRSVLTSQERRVAQLAAAGHTNLEISQALFLSTSTVDYHLSKIFRKFAITTRRRIAENLASE